SGGIRSAAGVRRPRAAEATRRTDAAGDARIAAAAPQADDRAVRRGASGGQIDRGADRTAEPGTEEGRRRTRRVEAGPQGCEAGRRLISSAAREEETATQGAGGN